MSGRLHYLGRLNPLRFKCTHRRCLFAIIFLLLAGCQSVLMNNLSTTKIDEQLYINAELNFAIKHPLNWKHVKIPVSSPAYRADTILWQAGDPLEESSLSGQMVIRRLPPEDCTLEDRLSTFLSDQPELTSGRVENFDHPVGPALKLLGQDAQTGRLTIALRGRQQDFLISLVYPEQKFAELLPIFEDIVKSFTEILRPENHHQKAS